MASLQLSHIQHRLDEDQRLFFQRLQSVLGAPLWFYGSIQRADYFPQSSDIDIAVVVDNPRSAIAALQHFLHIDKQDVKHLYQQFHLYKTYIHAYKLKYKQHNIAFDLTLYQPADASLLLHNLHDINHLSAWMVSLLYLLKSSHYTLQLCPRSLYQYLKNALFDLYFHQRIGWYSKDKSPTIITPLDT